ncbi:MAG: alanine dehydrogenase [Gemmatimonadota bacterium]|nr:MAG: alanine dehydrogenase [Gemmatimonadota bacterium]
MGILGVRREDKSPWERRTPLVPTDVARLVQSGVKVHVQKSPNRCFPDADFAKAGAELVDELHDATVILGVKEVPVDRIIPGKSYLFFSHTMKGQPYNMPMLRKLLDEGCTLMDYELVTDEDGVRTIAFGRFAGLAGAIDTLWALGQRFQAEGIDTPFAELRQSLDYQDLEEAFTAVRAVGKRIAQEGLPREITPLAIAVTGEGGKVWGGALEVLELLPHRKVAPAELPGWVSSGAAGRGADRDAADLHQVALVSYGPGELVEPIAAGGTYAWEDYLHHPEKYRARFGQDLPHLTAIVHGIYWAEGYPRFVLRQDVERLYANGATPRLRLITDITCDVDGSNEALVKITEPGDPAYVLDPDTWKIRSGFQGRGPVVLGVDILPAELPRDASRHFSAALVDLAPHLAKDEPFPSAHDPSVPGPLRRCLMVLRGQLTSPWDERLAEPLAAHGTARNAS